ncbi:MAG: tetratricopeptide repeat protein [Pirellulales bacterium]
MSTSAEPFNRALELERAGRSADAVRLYQEIVRTNPAHAQAWEQLGCIATRSGQCDAAIEYFVRAIRIDGGQAPTHNYLGECFLAKNELAKAEASFKQAIRLLPAYVTARVNLCLTHLAQGRLSEAEDCAQQALASERTSAEDHWTAASLRLLRGELPDAWEEHEWRLKLPGRQHHTFPGLKWDGRPLAGAAILLYAEQGLGDGLQFARYVPQVIERGGRPILVAPKQLVPLLRESFGLETLAFYEMPPACPFHCSLLSLPWVFGTTLSSIPADVPYLRTRSDLVATWRERLAAVDGFRVGINWQGNRSYTLDAARSIPLAQFAALARVPGVRLISLQQKDGVEQLQNCGFDVISLGDGDPAPRAFMDTAAIMQNLDLVITSDTSMAHLAGALGVRVWTALPIVPGWRWLLERSDSPWYPTMRIFRQTRAGDWADVFQRIADELQRAVTASRP